MSLIKVIKAQLGLSVTPANNFTWDASSNGGATPLKLTRGDAVDIMTVDAAGTTSLRALAVPNYADDATASAAGIPVGGLYRTGTVVKVRAA